MSNNHSMRWHVALGITLFLIALFIGLGMGAVWYIKTYMDEQEHDRRKAEFELQERRDYLINNPMVPADKMGVVIMEDD